MTQKIMEQLEQFGKINDAALLEKIDNAQTLTDIVSLLNEQGVEITEEDLRAEFEEGELDENSLDNIAGGSGIKIGFFHGFSHGSANDQYKNGGGPLYRLGSKCGQIICGHRTSW